MAKGTVSRGRRIVRERSAELCERYRNGESLNALAMDTGLAVGTVSVVLRRLGVEMRPGGPRPRADGLSARAHNRWVIATHGSELVRRYGAGETMDSLMAEFDISREAIRRHLVANGVTIRPRGNGSPFHKRGAGNPAYKNGTMVSSEGYRLVLVDIDDPLRCMAQSKGYVPEHRLVMARVIGRPLLPDETVHHIDGDRLNNDPSNLQLRRGRHGNGAHFRCVDCGSMNVRAEKI